MDAPPANAQQKLGMLHQRFNGFEREMEMETRSRKTSDESQLGTIKDDMSKLERTLNSEIKRRVEANKALQGMFESQIATVQDKLEAVFVERLDRLQARVDSLNDRMGVVEKDFSQSREKYIRDIEDKNQMVAKDVASLQVTFRQEKVDRKEREQATALKLRDHASRTAAKFEEEEKIREQKYQALREELEESKRLRERGDDKFQAFILEEVAALKNGLVVETQTREHADDDIVNSLHHYTHVLQDALRVVNRA